MQGGPALAHSAGYARWREMRAPPFLLLVLSSALSVVSINMFLPALPEIARDFAVSPATAGWAISGYLGITAVLQLGLGPLSDRIGRRPVVLWGLGFFALAAIGCAVATSFAPFLAARLAMGVVVGVATAGMAAVRDTADTRGAARRLSWIAMGMAIGPMLGPVLGGVLAAALGWRAIFWALALSAIAVWAVALRRWPETARGERDWRAQLRGYPELLRTGAFWAYASSVVTGIGCFFAFIAGAPIVGAAVYGLGVAEIGLTVGLISGGFFVGTGLSGRFSERAGLGRMILAGRSLQAVALALSGLGLALGLAHPAAFFAPIVLVGLGNGLANPSGQAGVMSARPELAGSAAGASGAMVLAGGAVLTALSTAAAGMGIGAFWAVLMLIALCGAASGVWCLRVERRGALA